MHWNSMCKGFEAIQEMKGGKQERQAGEEQENEAGEQAECMIGKFGMLTIWVCKGSWNKLPQTQ